MMRVLRSMMVLGVVTAVLTGLGRGQSPAADAPLGAVKAFPYEYVFPRPPAAELAMRRDALAVAVGSGVVVLVSPEGPELSSGGRYKPDNDLYYLTGVDTEFCAYVQVCRGGKTVETKLFLPNADRNYELWNGRRVVAGDEAKAMTGIDDIVVVRPGSGTDGLKPLAETLKRLAETPPGPFYVASPGGGRRARDNPERLELNPIGRAERLREYLVGLSKDLELKSITGAIDGLRGVKSAYEISMIRAAIRATGDGFVRGFRAARPGMWEFEFQAIMEHAFLDRGCTGLPYYPIAASGPNALVLHYNENRRRFEDGDIVLCDIAGEYGYYASDITRSFPANGKFTARQRQVYEAVLAGQTAAAKALKPGATLFELDKACRDAMKAGGLSGAEMYSHGLGHHVGLNVHDLGSFSFVPGMVITIEPGSYIRKENLGIRIEDCYLVTETGAECLSAAIPRLPDELEALVGADHRANATPPGGG